MGALSSGWSSRFLGLWLCLQREQPHGAFRNACLTNILLTFADSLLHCLFFLVPWICWFLSLLLGLCPRHCIISVFVFGSCVSGRYLHLDTNVNIIHLQVNNSNKIQGSEDPWHGKEGRDTALPSAGPSPASLPGISHHHLHLVLLSLQALLLQTVLDNELKFRITEHSELKESSGPTLQWMACRHLHVFTCRRLTHAAYVWKHFLGGSCT